MNSIAIITRTVDRPVMLERALQSILGQTFHDWHWVVVDSGKTDSVSRLIQVHASQLQGRLTHLRFDNPSPGMRGIPINAGIKASQSDFITLLDDDDTWEPSFLEKMVTAIKTKPHPNARGVVCQTRCIEESPVEDGLQQLRAYDLNADLFNLTLGNLAVMNRFCTHAFLYERVALDTVGLYPEDYPVLEDWHFNLRFLQQHEILVLPEIITNYHFRPSDQAGSQANSQTAERNDHKFHEARLINEAFREDIRTGRNGLGFLLAQAAISRSIFDTLHRHESRLKTISDKIGKIDSRTKDLKDRLIGKS